MSNWQPSLAALAGEGEQENEGPADYRGRLIAHLEAEVARLTEERDAFYMDYRMKCDEQTKAQAERIAALELEVVRKDEALIDLRAERRSLIERLYQAQKGEPEKERADG